jgi:hypothetical protein
LVRSDEDGVRVLQLCCVPPLTLRLLGYYFIPADVSRLKA